MRISKFLNAAIGVFLFASCSSTYYYADFIAPSDVYIPSKIYAVGVINRGAGPDLTAAIYTGGIPFDYIKGLPEKVGQKTVADLKSGNEKLNRYKLIPIYWYVPEQDEPVFMPEPFTSFQIDSLCDAYQVDGIVALEGIDLSIQTEGEVNVVSAVDQTGVPMRVPEFTSNQQVSYTVAWRFYDGLALKTADVYQQTYQRYFNRVAYDPDEAAEINPEEMQLFDVATQAAQDYQNRISPHWEPGFRLYYRGNTTQLQTISQNLESNRNWTAAAAEWAKLTASKDSNEKYYASFNMAVASEMLGKPRLAKEWLKKAKAIKDNKRVKKYMATIKEQILIYDVVDQQLGLDKTN